MKKILFLLAMLPMLVFTACSDDDENSLSLDKSEISLYYEDEIKLIASDNVTWSSEDEFVAKVSSNGIVEGGHVGKTFIVASNGAETVKCAVEVKPKYNTFVEPVLDFGANKADIKAKEKRELISETATGLGYKDSKDGVAILYTFEDDKMESAGFTLKYKYADDIMDFLLERYAPATMDTDNYSFVFVNGFSERWTMGVIMQIQSGYILVGYIPSDIGTRNMPVFDSEMMEYAKDALGQ